MVNNNNKVSNRSQLQYFSKDPNKQKRGSGFYYNRTWKDKGFSTNYMSKYDSKLDYAKGKKTGGSRKFAQTTDNPKKAGNEILTYRNKLSSDGKMYGTQRVKIYSKDKSEKYLEKKTGLKTYKSNQRKVNKYEKEMKTKYKSSNKNIKKTKKSKYSSKR